MESSVLGGVEAERGGRVESSVLGGVEVEVETVSQLMA